MISTKVLNDVLAERKRQDAKWGEQNHAPDVWLQILMEEVGEVSKAILEGSGWDYIREMTQVAAVAMAALEKVDRQQILLPSIVSLQLEVKALREARPKIEIDNLREVLIDASHARTNEKGEMVWEIDTGEVADALREIGVVVVPK